MQTKILLLIVLLTSCVATAQNLADAPSAHHYVATAQNLADAPSAHNYWDRTNKILVIAHIGLETADFMATHHNLSAGGEELNPLAKPLCEPSG